MSDRPFLDTNILVYAIQEDPRSETAEELVAAGGTVSLQVLNEFVAVVRRKISMPWDEIRLALEAIESRCPGPLPITRNTHKNALVIAEKYGFQIYDALIVASALEARCSLLYSEDLQAGQIIEKQLTIRNPFA
jgi:predicted nucleic acid-binding protein